MFSLSNPDGVHRLAPSYSLAAAIEPGARRVVVSGQVGSAPDGSVPDDAAGQIENVYGNLRTVLKAHGMDLSDIVKTTVFLTDRAHLGAYREARARIMGDHVPASTLVFVSGLADTRFVVEIEAEAAG